MPPTPDIVIEVGTSANRFRRRLPHMPQTSKSHELRLKKGLVFRKRTIIWSPLNASRVMASCNGPEQLERASGMAPKPGPSCIRLRGPRRVKGSRRG